VSNHKIDILPSPQELGRALVRRDEIATLVQEEARRQVAEIMAERDALAFEPWFRSRQVAYELKRLQTVPEQEKFSIAYERYGCLKCETHDLPHGGNWLCTNCRAVAFRRLTQIIAEGMKGEPARRARGTARAERLLPENAPRDGVHRTWLEPYKRNTDAENALYARVAKRLRLKPSYVSSVARGWEVSAPVSTALEEERTRQRLLGGGK
jgi:hypothetical protein